MSTRNDCLARLLTNISAITSIKSVERGNEDPGGAGGYTKAELPLAIIKAEQETVDYETNRYGYWLVKVSLFLYFLSDEDETTDRETLVAAIKNKIGEDPTLNGLCEMCEITSIVSSGAYPLYKETFALEFKYEQSISVA